MASPRSSAARGGVVGIGAAQHVYGPANVHLLPCKIHFDGQAPVATYFQPSTAGEADLDSTEGELVACFRGRKLLGKDIKLPDGVQGVVLKEQICPAKVKESHDDLTSYWEAETSFDRVRVWGHDELPRESSIQRSLGWMQVASAVHDP